MAELADAETLQQIDNEDIHIWAEKNVNLQGAYALTGPFRVGLSRYIIEPLRAIKDHTMREVVCLAVPQTFKTGIADIALQWFIANRPGPTYWAAQSNTTAWEHMESRLIPSIKSCKAIKNLVPKDIRELRRDGIYFPHMPFFISGPGEKRLQGKSIQQIILDETWLYDSGTIEWARKRVSQYIKYGLSKVLIISQAGYEDDDTHEAYKRGTCEEWHVPCLNPSCGEYFMPDIKLASASGKKWNDKEAGCKNEDKTYNYGKLEEMLTLACPKCKHLHKDTDSLKQEWNERGKYVQTNLTPMKGRRSFRWNSWVFHPWIEIVQDFIVATHQFKQGVTDNLLTYFQQREGRPVNENSLYSQDRHVKWDVEYSPVDKWVDEKGVAIGFQRFMTIDVQETEFYWLIREWARDGRSRLCGFGCAYSPDELVKIQSDWQINPGLVWIDTGHRTREIYSYIIKYKWRGIKGIKDKRGFNITRKDKYGRVKKEWRYIMASITGGDPAIGKAMQGKLGKAQFFLLCVNPIKNILKRLRDGNGVEWMCLPQSTFDLKEYNRQMFSEYPKKIINKYGKEERFWIKIKSDLPNDYWDLETYQVAMALECPYIDIQESLNAYHSEEVKEGDTEDTVGEAIPIESEETLPVAA